jgi:hypothetical protein
VYTDNEKAHPASAFDQETLKGRVRGTLEQLQPGTTNNIGGLQPCRARTVLELTKATDAHTTRSIISLRHTIVKNTANPRNRPTGSDSTGSGPIGDLDPLRSKPALGD